MSARRMRRGKQVRDAGSGAAAGRAGGDSDIAGAAGLAADRDLAAGGGLAGGGLADGGAPESGVPQGGLADGGAPESGVRQGGVTGGGVADGGAADGGVTDGGVTGGGAAEGGAAEGGAAEGGAAADGGEIRHETAGQPTAQSTPAGSAVPDQGGGPVRRLRSAAMSLLQRGQAGASDPRDVLPAAWAGSPSPPAAAPDSQVPRLLQQAAAWSWRLLLVAIVIYLAFRAASALRLVVLPFIAALLLTALLQPLTSRLRRAGMPSLAATWCTVLAAIVFLAGLGILTANRVSADYPTLVNEVHHTVNEVQVYLAGPPFRINSVRLQNFSDQVVKFVVQHKTDIAGSLLVGGRIFLELAAGSVLTIFITFFLLKDGKQVWSFAVSGLGPEARRRADNAGAAAWSALVNYIRGTTAVAAIHAAFIGVALWILGVPLLVPFIILVFLAAFVPLIGILVVGALAIVVTLATKGLIAAVILVVVFLVENQIEGHLLQPLVVGRIVRLHPLAIILVLAVGGIVAGIPGAIVAVPAAAVIFYAWPFLRQEQMPPEQHLGPPPDGG